VLNECFEDDVDEFRVTHAQIAEVCSALSHVDVSSFPVCFAKIYTRSLMLTWSWLSSTKRPM